jgi:toxin ParE1/3/4
LKTYSVVISKEAEADLFAIYEYILERAGHHIALRFVEQIEQYCLDFSAAPKRGTKRDDLRPGLRTVGFKRRATILFEVQAAQVIIHGVYYGGRSFEETIDGED